MGFNTTSVWLKVALICLALGLLLFVIGFSTNSWKRAPGTAVHRYGLWTEYACGRHLVTRAYVCGDNDITTRSLEDKERYGQDWVAFYRATQVFECLGLICAALALLILFIFIFVDSMRKRSALIAVIVLSFVAVACMCIGYAVFGTQFPYDYYKVGWSMGIAIAGTILVFIAAVFEVIDLKK